ncbi:hypothetical protein [Gemmatimonas sp. UBA7669]|uniref:hypothetical protein n=1 Tax=Gemmatimonas sp. UBA7669 TaxID=1946568 RepID=UPI0025BF84BA|nr:hypothetical protein [Gemmatimonas sp. UBA7669]
MARALHVFDRHVDQAERATYLAALPARQARAAAVPAHFWVFEHAATTGHFLEFTEAASAELLAQALGVESVTDCWQEVRGA